MDSEDSVKILFADILYTFCFLVMIFLGILGVGYGYKGVDVGLVFVYASIIFSSGLFVFLLVTV